MANKTFYNICIIQPQGYVHSMAFLELAELLLYSIRDTGNQAEVRKNQLSPDGVNIIIGAHLLDPDKQGSIPANTVILNTEQLSGVYSQWRDRLGKWFESGIGLWDYSPANIDVIRDMGVENVKLLKIGYQPELKRIATPEVQDVDVLFYGSINERRKNVLQGLVDRGIKLKVLSGVYGNERDQWIGRSKVILNHHFYESQIFEIVRVFYLLTNAKPVVAEVNDGTTIEDRFRDGVVAAPYDQLVDTVCNLVNDETRLKEQGEKAFQSILKYPQVSFTRKIL